MEKNINIYISYVEEDKKIFEKMRTQLSILKRQMSITILNNSNIEQADIIICLITSNYLISNVYDIELKKYIKNQNYITIPCKMQHCLIEDRDVIQKLEPIFNKNESYISSDYDYMILTMRIKQTIIELQKNKLK